MHLHSRRSAGWLALCSLLVVAVAVADAQRQGGQGGRGRGAGAGRAGGPPPAPPVLPDGPVVIQSVEGPQRPQVRVSVVTRGLERPWGMAFLPDGSMLITERAGRVRVVRNGLLDPEPVAGAPEPVFAQGLSGLMDIALHPQFAENGYVYFTYHRRTDDNRSLTALARSRWDGTALTGTRDIFLANTSNQGSRIVFAPDGMLHMTIGGPGGGATEEAHAAAMRAQDPNDYGGKTLRLRDDGSVPPDNPFVGRDGYKPEIFTIGHRNPIGMAVNPYTNDVWAVEQGPQGGDELNILLSGRNYGWPVISLGRQYTGERVSQRFQQEGFEDPIVFWVPSIAVTGMTFYTGDAFPAWRQSVFVGSQIEARTAGTGHIQRIRFNDRWEEIGREPLLRELRQRIRDVRQGPDGHVYVLTDENNGVLLRLEPVEPSPE
jgi:aldose sugar dehydrogenase